MIDGKVFIIKVKWDENVHDAKVKRVFFHEENAMAYIDEQKIKEKYQGAFWIKSDRTMSDYVPCRSDKDIEIIKLEAQQSLIDDMVKDSGNSSILEHYWAGLEAKIINLNG